MFESRSEIFGLSIAVLIVAVMGLLTFHGAFKHVNKGAAASLPTLQVKIVTDSKTVGRFTPRTITVRVGQQVSFKNVSNQIHTVNSGDNILNSGDIGTNGVVWTYTPAHPGAYHYYCVYHPFMTGTLKVVKG